MWTEEAVEVVEDKPDEAEGEGDEAGAAGCTRKLEK